jgi:DNA-binding Xre family transcriptional regulator
MGCSIIVDYSPLWKTMEKKGVSQYRLIKSGVDNRTIDSLKNNRNITMNTLEKICKIINCTPNDVVRFK